jgi:hypothetical protein
VTATSTTPAETGLLAAMLAVQGESSTLPKDRTVTVKTKTGGEYSYSYAPLDSIVEKIGPLLVKNGLVWSTQPSNNAAGEPTLKYTLAHAPSKESIDGEMRLVIDEEHKEDVQALGSAITYARRYALSAVLNLVADADDDGRAAGGGNSASGGALASDKQKKFLRQLITQHRLDVHAMDTLLKGAGAPLAEGEKVNDAVNRLTMGQCSTLIEKIKDGPVRTGGSDVPGAGAGEFVHERADEMGLPFSPEVPS